MNGRRFWVVGWCALWLAGTPGWVRGGEQGARGPWADAKALANKIDEQVAARWAAAGVKPARPADDAEFLRRAYLDLAGRIPRVAEARDFLDDTNPDKRERLIDRLLSGPLYVTHFANVWRAWMLPPSNNQLAPIFQPGFEAWLRKQLREDAAYDRLARELLTVATPANANPRQLAVVGGGGGAESPFGFYQANELKAENLAARTSRLFLGVNLECAQCHNHPFAKWSRQQFWEYAAFFVGLEQRTVRLQDGRPQRIVGERREIQIPGTEKTVKARYLDGTEPQWKDGTSTRATLADWMTAADNPYFARAAVNRLWSYFFGLGLIEPVDEPSDENLPSHPELLNEAAKQFAAHRYDLKFLIRAITSSRAYGLSSTAVEGASDDPRLFARMTVRGLTPEQLFDSLAEATGYREGAPAGNARQVALAGGGGAARTEFLAKFANAADKRTEYQTSILQALALMNGKFVEDATSVERSERLAAVLDAPFLDTEGRLEVLFLSALTRKPRPEELQRLLSYVGRGGAASDEKKALADVFWALLNSSEFILNH